MIEGNRQDAKSAKDRQVGFTTESTEYTEAFAAMTLIPMEWLVRKASAEDFERESLQGTADAFSIPLEKVLAKRGDKPFGDMINKWRQFIGDMQDGDELWWFQSPSQSFERKMGRNGFAIIRDGEIHDTMIMLMT